MKSECTSTMWAICARSTAGAREVNGYPSGSVFIVRREFPEHIVQQCKKRSWNVVFASDGMDAEPLTDYYVVTAEGNLMGHLYDGSVLWYADFGPGGMHEYSYKRVNGELVRLGFSRW